MSREVQWCFCPSRRDVVTTSESGDGQPNRFRCRHDCVLLSLLLLHKHCLHRRVLNARTLPLGVVVSLCHELWLARVAACPALLVGERSPCLVAAVWHAATRQVRVVRFQEQTSPPPPPCIPRPPDPQLSRESPRVPGVPPRALDEQSSGGDRSRQNNVKVVFSYSTSAPTS